MKSKEVAWGLWTGLHFIGAHRFYTNDYWYASLMLATGIIPSIAIILLTVYTDLEGFNFFMLWFFILMLFGSFLWGWIDAFFLNKRIEEINHEQERKIIHRIKGIES
ncbi:NINE protein [Paenibacillus puerhi]|uniref:NINE protein n=1 Tax=Paenibacillus puerhi TaxID=2692622 RepID=UPI00135B3D84|nr:NINE protein [Paenibacillus puerhi]